MVQAPHGLAGASPGRIRLQRRPLHLLRRDYLTSRALRPALAGAVQQALAGRRTTRLRVLDLGCGERPYADLFGAAHCIGVDCSRDGATPDVVADAARLPLPEAAVDLVFCSQVLEHVPEPAALLAEAARVLRPGGALVLSAPFWWPLHEEPHDYLRFTCHGLDRLLRGAGLTPVSIEPDCGSLTVAMVALIEALPRWLMPLQALINLLTPPLQALSADRRSTLNWVVLAHRPPAVAGAAAPDGR